MSAVVCWGVGVVECADYCGASCVLGDAGCGGEGCAASGVFDVGGVVGRVGYYEYGYWGKPGLGWRVRQALPSRAESESMVSQAADWLGDASGRVVQYVGDNREDWLEAAQANSRVAGKRVVRAAVAAQEQAQAAYADAQVLSGRAARRAVRQADRLQVRAVRALRRAQERLDGKV